MARARSRSNSQQKNPSRQREKPSGSSSSSQKRSFKGSSKKTKLKVLPRIATISNRRVIYVWGILVLGIIGLGVRLHNLQVTEGPKLLLKARQQQITRLQPYVPRRSIIDNVGNVLAVDRLAYSVYVHPKLFKLTPEEVAEKLAPLLVERTTIQALVKKFKTKQTGIKLAKALPEDLANKIAQLNLDGVDLDKEYVRFYPQEELASEVIGYIDSGRQGQAGLENSQNQLLERDAPSFKVQQTAQGAIMPAFLPKGVLTFDELKLQLTVDLRLQRAARTALSEQLKKYSAKRGAVLVMDALDGSILAMVCEPTYNPNKYSEATVELFKNWTVSDLYEPGSTFKPINVAIALNAGVIKPETVIYDSGSIKIDGWNILNASKAGNGSINIAQILQVSSNIGMVQIMQRLPKEDYYQQLRKIGLGEKTNIDLPGEVASHLKNKEAFLYNSIEAATAAFGQGFSLTPVKLLQLHGSIANGGRLVTPHLIKGLVDPDGKTHWKPILKTTTLFPPLVARQVVEMMETVVTQGTGAAASVPGYRIGGKTGTAQKGKARGGYMANAKITSFVAILPVESPRYVVLVVVDEPKGGNTFGSTVAAPVAKSVIEALISLEGIPPSSNPPPVKPKLKRLD